MIDVVVLNYNDAEQTRKYVEMICGYSTIDHIAIVDNNSSDNSLEVLGEIHSDKVFIMNSGKNGGYGFGNNYGVKYLKNKFNSKYIAITNPDVEYEEESLIACVEFLKDQKNNEFAVVAPRMLNSKHEIENSGWFIPDWFGYTAFDLFILGKVFDLKKPIANNNNTMICDCVAGSMLVVDVDKFVDASMYDEKIFLYCEETVLGIRLKKKGYKTAILNNYIFVHMHSVSINKAIHSRVKQYEMIWKSRMYVLNEYYNINFCQRIVIEIIKFIEVLELKMRLLFRRGKDVL